MLCKDREQCVNKEGEQGEREGRRKILIYNFQCRKALLKCPSIK